MYKKDINECVEYVRGLGNLLVCDYDDSIILTGKIDNIYINKEYKNLYLYEVDCNMITYDYGNFNNISIYNHILPHNLTSLYIKNVIQLPEKLPIHLEILYCKYLNINHSFPVIPNTLQKLTLIHCNLEYLFKLPNNLILLHCQYNKIKYLPKLPSSLKELNCSYNKLISLPELPDSLKELDCNGNQLIFLPKLPNNLKLTYEGILEYVEYTPNLKLDEDSNLDIHMDKYEQIDSINKFYSYLNTIQS